MDDERYRLIVEASVHYAIFHVGLDGIIESWKPGAERIFGFAAQEIVGRHGSVLFVAEDVFRGEHDFLPKPFLPDQLAAKGARRSSYDSEVSESPGQC